MILKNHPSIVHHEFHNLYFHTNGSFNASRLLQTLHDPENQQYLNGDAFQIWTYIQLYLGSEEIRNDIGTFFTLWDYVLLKKDTSHILSSMSTEALSNDQSKTWHENLRLYLEKTSNSILLDKINELKEYVGLTPSEKPLWQEDIDFTLFYPEPKDRYNILTQKVHQLNTLGHAAALLGLSDWEWFEEYGHKFSFLEQITYVLRRLVECGNFDKNNTYQMPMYQWLQRTIPLIQEHIEKGAPTLDTYSDFDLDCLGYIPDDFIQPISTLISKTKKEFLDFASEHIVYVEKSIEHFEEPLIQCTAKELQSLLTNNTQKYIFTHPILGKKMHTFYKKHNAVPPIGYYIHYPNPEINAENIHVLINESSYDDLVDLLRSPTGKNKVIQAQMIERIYKDYNHDNKSSTAIHAKWVLQEMHDMNLSTFDTMLAGSLSKTYHIDIATAEKTIRLRRTLEEITEQPFTQLLAVENIGSELELNHDYL